MATAAERPGSDVVAGPAAIRSYAAEAGKQLFRSTTDEPDVVGRVAGIALRLRHAVPVHMAYVVRTTMVPPPTAADLAEVAKFVQSA